MTDTTQPSQAAREAADALVSRLFSTAFDIEPTWNTQARKAFARFERDTEKRVRESVGAAPDNIRAIVLKHTRVGGYPDTAAIARDAFAAGQNYCRESLAGEANVERVAKAILEADDAALLYRDGYPESEADKFARTALATLERTTDAG